MGRQAPALVAAVKDFARMTERTPTLFLHGTICSSPEGVVNNRLRGCSDFAPCPLVLIQVIALARVAARVDGW
jgi:hypothetical protein